MAGLWPWPKDTRVARLVRIIDTYRETLALVDAAACESVDDRMRAWGQGWVCNNEIVDVNEWASARSIADRHPVTVWDIYNWERDGLYSGKKVGARKRYKVGDILAAMATR